MKTQKSVILALFGVVQSAQNLQSGDVCVLNKDNHSDCVGSYLTSKPDAVICCQLSDPTDSKTSDFVCVD